MALSNYIYFSANRPHEKSFRFRACFLGGYHLCLGCTKTEKWNWYIYFSRNATPWASTFYVGSDWREEIRSKIRRKKLGWKFSPHTDDGHAALMEINEKWKWI